MRLDYNHKRGEFFVVPETRFEAEWITSRFHGSKGKWVFEAVAFCDGDPIDLDAQGLRIAPVKEAA